MAEDTSGDPGQQPKIKVFISYARTDLAFADQLVAALKERGFEAFIDRGDIAPGEPWSKRLEELIATADTVIFVLSPAAVASKSCEREVAFAASLNKRFIPIVCQRVSASQVPEQLREPNWIFFDDPAAFEESVAKLAQALETDIVWVRKHTQFSTFTQRWHAVGRPGKDDVLLRPPLLTEAEAFLIAERPRGVPAPTSLRDFVAVSRQAYDEEQAAIAQSQVNLLAQVADTERERGNLDQALRLCLHVEQKVKQHNRLDPSRADAALARTIFESRLRVALTGDKPAFSRDGRYIITRATSNVATVWDAATGIEIRSFHEAEGTIQRVAVSADAARVLVTSAIFHERTSGGWVFVGDVKSVIIRVWDFQTGRTIDRWQTEQSGKTPVASFNADGTCVVTASPDYSVRVREAQTGNEIAILRGHSKALCSAEFSSDGGLIVTTSRDHTARVWDLTTGKQVAVLRQPKWEGVDNATFSPDGERVAGCDREGIRIWNALSGRRIAMLRGQKLPVFSPDSMQIATTAADNTAYLWTLGGEIITSFRGHRSDVTCIVFSNDGKRIVTASADKTARIWTLPPDFARPRQHRRFWYGLKQSISRAVPGFRSHSSIPIPQEASDKSIVLRGHRDGLTSAAFSFDSSRVVTASSSRNSPKAVCIWNAEVELVLRGHEGGVKCAAFSNDGKRVVTASRDSTARIWDVASGREIALLRHEDIVHYAAFSPDGSRLLTMWGSLRGRCGGRLWNALTGDEIGAIGPNSIGILSDLRSRLEVLTELGERTIFSAAFSSDGGRIVTAANKAEIWDTARRVRLEALPVDSVCSAAFSPDETCLVLGLDKDVTIWPIGGHMPIEQLHGHTGFVCSASYSPDGKYIITASTDGTARIWDVQAAEGTKTLRGEDAIFFAAFSPDSAHIATASADNTARIWDASTGRELAVLRGHEAAVNCASFSPDGARVVTASDDATVRVWDVHFATMATSALIEEACTRRLRGLTKLTRDEMRLAGYPDSMPEIDVAEGLNVTE